MWFWQGLIIWSQNKHSYEQTTAQHWLAVCRSTNLAHTLVSACHKRRHIRSYRLTTCYGLHQKTSFVSIRLQSSAHSGDSSTQRPTFPSWPSIRSITWQGLETSTWPSSRALDWPTPQRHWICSCQPLQTDRPSYGATVERRDGPSWLRDDDDDDVQLGHLRRGVVISTPAVMCRRGRSVRPV